MIAELQKNIIQGIHLLVALKVGGVLCFKLTFLSQLFIIYTILKMQETYSKEICDKSKHLLNLIQYNVFEHCMSQNF